MTEADGLVTRRRGIGMVVTAADAARTDALRPETESLVHIARRMGITKDDLVVPEKEAVDDTP